VFLEARDLVLDPAVVGDQDLFALGRGRFAVVHEPDEAQHLADRHARVAQAAQHGEPLQVDLAEDATARGRTGNGWKQSDALVIAQGVEAEAAGSGGLSRGVRHPPRIASLDGECAPA
jgi:hypothetical protein